ncbi:MAG: efflux RND transporter periplasmic adaptor subunit [Bacteroidetes bacterium]|nr:efflux RND transporter periplasmic adaptor subunit [Bacteroidota bacterium]MBS1540489.1 efflux RND transporter periplasmic adaptor subunit [Bacteroidota bacterium]
MKKTIHLFFLVIALSIVSCGKKESQHKNTGIDETAVAVQLVAVQTIEYSRSVISSGLISTETESKLSFKVNGIISKIAVREGDAVREGQLLASLDLTEIKAQVAQAQNNLTKAQRDLSRGQRLLKDSAATVEQVQNLQTAFDVARENFRIASFNYKFSEIRANHTGKIIKKFVNEGELIGAGTPVLLLNSAAKNDWIVKIGLPDVDWVRIKKGDKAKITTDAYPNEPMEGELNSINEGADPMNGLYQAEVQIIPGNKKLATGLFAKVEIFPSTQIKLARVPVESIVDGQGKNAFVFVVNTDHQSVRKVPVMVSFLEGKYAYLSQHPDSLKEVVTGGSGFLTENSTIVINP